VPEARAALTSSANPSNSFYKYDVQYGEEYIVSYNYTTSLSSGTSITGGLSTRITIGTHTFIVGDQVVIDQADNGAANPQLQGLHTVTFVGATYIDVNVLYSLITDPTIDGNVKYADNRKTIFRNLLSDNNLYVFNGAVSFKEFRVYDEMNYLLNSPSDAFLTTQPVNNFYCTREQDIWVNIANDFQVADYIYFENSASSIFRKPITNNNIMTQVAVGPGNYGTLTFISGSSITLTDPGVTWYRYYFGDSTGIIKSQRYRIDLDERCNIEQYEVVFMDRLGSLSSFAFQLRAYERGTTKRDTYNKFLDGYISARKFRYDTEAAGGMVINPTVERTIELNTNWITEEMSVYFEELVTSPVTYLKDLDNNYYKIFITDTAFEINRSRNKNLFKKTITIKYANENIING